MFLKCLCGINCSTKILALTITPFLFILVSVLFEFAMVLGVNILLYPQEEDVNVLSWGHRCTYSATHSSEILYYYANVIVELKVMLFNETK